jgi:hypothetical protein
MPMTRHQATKEAQRLAKRNARIFYVIWSVEDYDDPGQHYHATDDDTLETFYLGCDPLAAYEPDGSVEGF